MSRLNPLPPFAEPPFVPKALHDLPQWVCYQADKVPICAGTGTSKGFTRLEMGRPYNEAVAATWRLGLAGVGFVLHAKNHLIGIDLDHCRDPKTGEIEPWAWAILELAETYAEVSPSGTGIHLFATGDLNGASTVKNTPAQVEMYTSGHYLTITGQHLENTPREVASAPATLAALYARLAAFPVKPAGPTGAKTGNPAPAEGSAEAFSQHAYRQTFFGKVNDLAMKSLGEWVPELFPSASLEAGTGAWRVKSADLGRPFEEDISIHPDGIVDFGVHDMGDEREGKRSPIDLVVEWLVDDWDAPSTTPATAALWLCGKLKTDPRGLGWRGSGAEPVNSGDTPPAPEPAAGAGAASVRRLRIGELLSQPGFKHAKAKTILPGFDVGEVTLVGGPSGAMKSLWVQQSAIAIVAEKPSIVAETEIDYCGSVVFYANEDAPEQVTKRLAGIALHHKLPWPQKHEVHVWDGRLLTRKGADIKVNEVEVAALEGLDLIDGKIALIVVDTLAAALVSEETNLEFQQTMNLLKALAIKLKVAIAVVHHFRKGQPGGRTEEPTLESLRGGSTLTAAARNVLFIEPPSAKEAKSYRLDNDADKYMKLNPMKRSYGARGGRKWFERELVGIEVEDDRDGSEDEEDAPVLVPFYPNDGPQRMAEARDALAKLNTAVAAGITPIMRKRGANKKDSVQTIIGLGNMDAKRVIDTLVNEKAVVLTKILKTRNNIVVLRILTPELAETLDSDDENDEN